MERARTATEELYSFRDSFSPNPDEKLSKLKSMVDSALRILDSVPKEERKSPLQRASFEHLRGKILDVFPVYRKEAEDHLSKAVKLNPSLSDAWLCLGTCLWKKNDLASAKNCLSMALSKAPSQKIYCYLSMLERKMAEDSGNQAEGVEESIRLAKKAITMDVKDGNSWYCLGNAYLTSFFANEVPDSDRLFQSIKAYQNAEKDENMKHFPDLYFHWAAAYKYVQNYERALTGFEAAALKDPGLNATEQIQKIVNLLDRIEDAMKVQCRRKCIYQVPKSFKHGKFILESLAEGQNKRVSITGRVLHALEPYDAPPLYYIVCDSEQKRFVLAIYGMDSGVLKEEDWVTLIEPYHQSVNFSWKDKQYRFTLLRVDSMGQLAVNGKSPSTRLAIQATIQAYHKPL